MPAYMVVHAVITDPEQFSRYAQAAAELMNQFGGEYVVRGTPAETLEGEWPHELSTVISKWPSVGAAEFFWHSPEYEQIRRMREGAAEIDVVIFEGL